MEENFLSTENNMRPESMADVFFKTRLGLWVSDDFRNHVVSKMAGVGSVVGINMINYERIMTDTEIEETLGDGHIFTEDELCATLEGMIQDQWDGKSGQLLNNGCANLFYLDSGVVKVLWGNDQWSVDICQRDDSAWLAGYRVFTPTS